VTPTRPRPSSPRSGDVTRAIYRATLCAKRSRRRSIQGTDAPAWGWMVPRCAIFAVRPRRRVVRGRSRALPIGRPIARPPRWPRRSSLIASGAALAVSRGAYSRRSPSSLAPRTSKCPRLKGLGLSSAPRRAPSARPEHWRTGRCSRSIALRVNLRHPLKVQNALPFSSKSTSLKTARLPEPART
jgi:hypothetical protein